MPVMPFSIPSAAPHLIWPPSLRNEDDRKHAAGSARIVGVRVVWGYSQDSDIQVGQTVVEWTPVGATIDASKDAAAGGSGVKDIGIVRIDHEASEETSARRR